MSDALQYKIVGTEDGNAYVAYTSQPGVSLGTTAERPDSPNEGHQYFDTTLGQPVWYDGTGWVDATGTTA